MATKIRGSNIDPAVVNDQTELSGGAASADAILVFDASAGTIRKVTQTKFLNFPTITSVSPTNVNEGDGTGNHTFIINGSGFTGGSANLVNDSGSTVNFDTVTVNSDIKITGVIAKSSLPAAGEPYDVKVVASTNLTASLANQININASPVYTTAAGSLGSFADGARSGISLDIVSSDPESAGNVSYEIVSGALPGGLSSATVHENGVSKFRISGNANAVGSDTTSNFRLRAIDAASNTVIRAFSITILAPAYQTFTASGTFAVPTGLTSVNVLVVGGGGHGGYQHGGGGGAGGLIYMPAFPVTPGATMPVTVGNGGQPSGGGSPGFPGMAGQDSVFGTLTAKGGGVGGSGCSAVPNGDGPGTAGQGGSGGGGGYCNGARSGGQSIQSTQPGNSGAYGFGNAGGNSQGTGGAFAGAGGGGAGAAGANSPGTGGGGNGGVGKAYTISDGTTSVFYAGGGGGSNHQPGPIGQGAQGGGGQAGNGPKGNNGAPGPAATAAQPGTANRGGGGGGAHHAGQQSSYSCTPQDQGNGGKGVVIINY